MPLVADNHFTLDILNNIRDNASTDYQDRVPAATQENITAVGNAISAYEPTYNEFCASLIHKIGKTIIEQKLFKNRLARFKSGGITTQQDVEEIFIEMAKAESAYDPDGKNPLGRRNPPPVHTLYHRMNRRDVYTISIGDVDFRRAFRSEANLSQFITGLINSVYSGANYDEYLHMKNLLATFKKGGDDTEVADKPGYALYEIPSFGSVPAADAAKAFVKTLRKAVADLTLEPSTLYNPAGVMTWSAKEDLVLFVHKDILAEVDVEVLAKAFNLGKTDMEPEIVPMADLGNPYFYGILMDKDCFRVFDTLSHMEQQRNAHGLFTNYFYHVHQILSMSRFKNAVALIDAAAMDAEG